MVADMSENRRVFVPENHRVFVPVLEGESVIKCDCGWVSGRHRSESDARAEHTRHVDAGHRDFTV